MSIKHLSLLLVPLFSFFTSSAQDKIYKKDGLVIDAKVTSIGTSKISYKRYNSQDGLEYSFSKDEVTKILYQNGTSDIFNSDNTTSKENRTKTHHSKIFGSNIFAFMPGVYTAALNGSINDPGLGISYERLLDEDGHFGFSLPFLYSFLQNKDFNNNYNYYSSSSHTYTGANNYSSLTFMPGIKFYPAKENRQVRYSLGLSFFATFGSEPYSVYDYNSSGIAGDWKYTVYGAMVSNSINVTVARHFYIAMDINGGVPFSDNRHKDASFLNNDVALPVVQFILKTGVRF